MLVEGTVNLTLVNSTRAVYPPGIFIFLSHGWGENRAQDKGQVGLAASQASTGVVETSSSLRLAASGIVLGTGMGKSVGSPHNKRRLFLG